MAVVLLVNGNDADVSDRSGNEIPIVIGTGTASSTTESKYGGASVATTASYTTAWNTDFVSGTNPLAVVVNSTTYTVESWIFFAGGDGYSLYPLRLRYTGAGYKVGIKQIARGDLTTSREFCGFLFDAFGDPTSTASVILAENVWHHVAVVVSGTALAFYANGVLIESLPAVMESWGASTTTGDVFADTTGVGLYYDDTAISDTARYSGGTYTVPTAFAESILITAATLALNAPTPALAISAHIVTGSGSLSITPPTPTISCLGGANGASIVGTSPTLTSLGHDSTGENAFSYIAPIPTINAYGGANARLTAPRPTLNSAATGANWGKTAITAPTPALQATGTTSGTAQTHITAPSPNLIGYGGAVCSITLTGKATVLATGTTGTTGSVQITAPLFALTASASAQNYGSINIIAPAARLGAQAQAWIVAPGAVITAIGTAVVTATYEAYALNLKHADPQANDELTRYTNFPFTHIVRYQNSYYGANTTGLYLLEGTTDDGTAIPWEFKTATTDADTPQMKTVEMVYFGGRMAPESTVSITVGEGTPVTYDYTTPRGATAQNYRQPLGRGLKSRYFAIGASGDGELALDTLTLNVATLARKV